MEVKEKFHLQLVKNDDERNLLIELLRQHNLPTADIDKGKQLYLLTDGDRVIGTAGLEIFDDCGLLRSVSIVKQEQGKSYGTIINNEIEKIAQQQNTSALYLLTTGAKQFFSKHGYILIDRNEAPLSIKQTTEFSSLCPSSAIVMKKKL